MKELTTEQKRKLYRQYHETCNRLFQEWEDSGFRQPPPQLPPYPDELVDMTCGAKTRKGTPCKRRDLYISGRCRLHGGLSTGPRTNAGKAISALNGLSSKKYSNSQET